MSQSNHLTSFCLARTFLKPVYMHDLLAFQTSHIASCRGSQQDLSLWEQVQPQLTGLFSQQQAVRQTASSQLARQPACAAAVQLLADQPNGAEIAADPVGRVLDGGVSAHVTAICAGQVSSSFRYCLALKTRSLSQASVTNSCRKLQSQVTSHTEKAQ